MVESIEVGDRVYVWEKGHGTVKVKSGDYYVVWTDDGDGMQVHRCEIVFISRPRLDLEEENASS